MDDEKANKWETGLVVVVKWGLWWMGKGTGLVDGVYCGCRRFKVVGRGLWW